MSRTLRRPMFRGGRVSSYGTGITSGLADGGRVGYYNGELVTGGNLMNMTRDQALKLAELYSPTSIERFPGETESYQTVTEPIMGTGKKGYDWLPNWFKRQQPKYETFKSYVTEGDEVPIDTETGKEREVVAPGEIGDTVTGQGYIDPDAKITKKKTIGELELEKIRAELEQLRKDGAGSESLDIDKKTYLKLLGGDKAKGKDITAMLLGFAGSKGDTTMEKFQNFAATEATRPGKREALEEGAAMLAIKDYIAGKRSKEQLDVLLSQLDYKGKLSKKNLAEHISEARKTRSGVGALKDGIQAWRPGVKIEEILSTEALEFGSEDEGVIFIETDTKDVYTIKDGAKIPLYTS